MRSRLTESGGTKYVFFIENFDFVIVIVIRLTDSGGTKNAFYKKDMIFYFVSSEL